MNTNILKKCIDELKKEKPEIQYVLGMLETLYEIQKPTVIVPGTPTIKSTEVKDIDEKAMLDAKAKAAIDEIKRLEAESVSTNVVKN